MDGPSPSERARKVVKLEHENHSARRLQTEPMIPLLIEDISSPPSSCSRSSSSESSPGSQGPFTPGPAIISSLAAAIAVDRPPAQPSSEPPDSNAASKAAFVVIVIEATACTIEAIYQAPVYASSDEDQSASEPRILVEAVTDATLPLSCRGLPLRVFIREAVRRGKISCSTLRAGVLFCVRIAHAVRRLRIKLAKVQGKLLNVREEDKEEMEALAWDTDDEGLDPAALEAKLLANPLLCGRRCFLVSIIIASKFLQDRTFSLAAWSKLSGLTVKELEMNERLFLTAIEWRLWVCEQEWAEWCTRLSKVGRVALRQEEDEAELDSYSPTEAPPAAVSPSTISSTPSLSPSSRPVADPNHSDQLPSIASLDLESVDLESVLMESVDCTTDIHDDLEMPAVDEVDPDYSISSETSSTFSTSSPSSASSVVAADCKNQSLPANSQINQVTSVSTYPQVLLDTEGNSDSASSSTIPSRSPPPSASSMVASDQPNQVAPAVIRTDQVTCLASEPVPQGSHESTATPGTPTASIQSCKDRVPSDTDTMQCSHSSPILQMRKDSPPESTESGTVCKRSMTTAFETSSMPNSTSDDDLKESWSSLTSDAHDYFTERDREWLSRKLPKWSLSEGDWKDRHVSLGQMQIDMLLEDTSRLSSLLDNCRGATIPDAAGEDNLYLAFSIAKALERRMRFTKARLSILELQLEPASGWSKDLSQTLSGALAKFSNSDSDKAATPVTVSGTSSSNFDAAPRKSVTGLASDDTLAAGDRSRLVVGQNVMYIYGILMKAIRFVQRYLPNTTSGEETTEDWNAFTIQDGKSSRITHACSDRHASSECEDATTLDMGTRGSTPGFDSAYTGSSSSSRHLSKNSCATPPSGEVEISGISDENGPTQGDDEHSASNRE